MRMASIDKLGRIVIPSTFRDQLGLVIGSELVITQENNSVVIRPARLVCRRCCATVAENRDFPLCKDCFEVIHRMYADVMLDN